MVWRWGRADWLVGAPKPWVWPHCSARGTGGLWAGVPPPPLPIPAGCHRPAVPLATAMASQHLAHIPRRCPGNPESAGRAGMGVLVAPEQGVGWGLSSGAGQGPPVYPSQLSSAPIPTWVDLAAGAAVPGGAHCRVCGVCVCVHGCVQRCAWMCTSVHGCSRMGVCVAVCMGVGVHMGVHGWVHECACGWVWMCGCVWMCMGVHAWVYAWVCVAVGGCACMAVCVGGGVHAGVCMGVQECACMCTCMYAWMSMSVHGRVCARMSVCVGVQERAWVCMHVCVCGCA